MTTDLGNYKNSLRYYGTISNVGLAAEYDVNDHNTIAFNANHYKEDLKKDTKHTNVIFEPFQKFKRTADRNTYGLSWKGNNQGSTDWNVELNYARMNEDDITVTSDYQKSIYEGKNTLNYVDDIDHRQYDFKASANTQVNDRHMFTYSVTYTYEKGEGSRLKSAPDTYTRTIDPWYYGYTKNNANTQMTEFAYADFLRYYDGSLYGTYANIQKDPEAVKRYQKFEEQLKQETGNAGNYYVNSLGPIRYYLGGYDLVFSDKQFQEIYNLLQNQQTIGQATIRKQSVFLQDTWQVNKDTILSPIIRLDHSSLFGSTVTANMGMTHNLGGNSHRRLKANFGTGYTEPGMGELYYNWEMYSGSAAGIGTGRLGWYWVGNPDLKPEKSVNIDLSVEGENKNTYARAGVFYNGIRDYMTTYFTGNLLDFHPEYNEKNTAGQWKFMNPPDMIYSFKNIGKAEITGF
jgi:outer membrane receptor for ferrienterochelin and colicin